MSISDIQRDVAAAFAGNVAEHRMFVRLDQGLYRHLVFEQREYSWNDRFELITVPGSLTITGGRGSHVFRRMADMFQFFRSNGNEHGINPGYWAEKLPDAGRSVKVYSEDVLKARIEEHIADWREVAQDQLGQYELDKAAWDNAAARDRWPFGDVHQPEKPKTLEEIRELVADYEADGQTMDESGARDLLRELEKADVVSDTWEWDLSDWDYHFLWCLHAIAWGIAQYDAAVKSGLHVRRTAPMAWNVPLPTVAPIAPAPRDKPAKGTPINATITPVPAGGVL